MVLLLIFALVCLQSAGADIKTLYVVVHAPFPDVNAVPGSIGWEGGPSLVPGVKLAIEQINNRSDIISDYYLKLIVSDSGCNLHLKARVSQVKNVVLGPDPVVGIIGPACSEAALATAEIQNRLQIIQITTATTPLLNNHVKYPFTFGIVSSSSIYADAILQLMMDKHWTRVAILYEINRSYFSFTYTKFLKTLPPKLIEFASGMTQSYIPLEEVWDARTRVIIVLASDTQARLMMCLAYHQKLLFPSFQFVFIDRQSQSFVKPTTVSHRGKTYKCSEDEMVTVINGVILNHYNLDPVEPNTTLVSQSTYVEYEAQYRQKLEEYGQERNESIRPSIWANPFYDATWALALSLNSCIPEIASDFTNLSCIRNEMYNVNFLGTTGNVTFDNVIGHASTVVKIYQVCNNTDTVVGHYTAEEIQYVADGVFVDSSFKKEFDSVPVFLASTILIVATLAFLLTVFFHIINTWKRNHHSIKATSPKLNNLIFLGCYLVIATIVIVTIHETYPSTSESFGSGLCNAAVWSFTTAYTLILGTICVKSWRLFFIFKHTFKKDRFLSNKSLFIFVLILLLLNFVICLIWVLVDPVTQDKDTTVTESGNEPVIITRVLCQYSSAFISIEIVYMGLLAFIVVYLSIYNRRIKKKDFKHTTSVNVFVYSLCLFIALGIPTYTISRSISFILGYITICAMLTVMAYLCIFLLFLPPAIPLLKRWSHVLKVFPVRLCCYLETAP